MLPALPLLACVFASATADAVPTRGAVDSRTLSAELEAAGGDRRAPTVVDLRDEAAYAPAHIRTSLRMNVRELLASRALARGPVVLVGPAVNPCLAMEASGLAAAAGFADVRVLDGGMEAWLRAGLPVESSHAAHAQDPWTVTAVQLVAASRCRAVKLRIVDTDGGLVSAMKLLKVNAAAPPVTPLAKYKPRGNDAGEVVVFLGADPAAAQRRAQDLRKARGGNLLALVEPARAYAAMLMAETPGEVAPCKECGRASPPPLTPAR